MSDFDMDAFDSIDFDSVEQSVAEKQAKKEKQEGIVRIAFTMDRQGNVLNRQVDTSSGYPYLDAAALKMFDDANPLPPVPDDFAPGRMELPLVMPIDFTLITNTSFGD